MGIRMYRYSASRYTQSLLKLGCIRVGTLHDFRRLEHSRGIADPQEGKKLVTHWIEDFSAGRRLEIDSKAITEFGVASGDLSKFTMTGCHIARSFDESDVYILCFSSRCSSETMAQFEGTDSCLEILDTSKFLNRLTETISLISPVVFQGCYEVVYGERRHPWNGEDWGQHPSLLKETEFSKQYEFRAIWKSEANGPIEPLILCDYQSTQYCSEVAL